MRFNRIFPFIHDTESGPFPMSGAALNAREVDEHVSLVHEMFRADTKHEIVLIDHEDSAAMPVGEVTIFGYQPLTPGHVFLPYVTGVVQTGGAPLPVQVAIQGGTKVQVSPTRLWSGDYPAYDVTIPDDFQTIVPGLPSVPGNRMSFTILGAGVGTLLIRQHGVVVPLYCFDWSRWPMLQGSSA